MATINREPIAPLHEKITVTVSTSDYNSSYESSLKKYAKSANIPGFRKGMVPTGVVKKMYGASVFAEEVLKSIENELMNYLQQENISYLGQPIPEDANDPAMFNHNEPKDYSFSFEIGLKPEFTIPNLATTPTTLHVVEATDEMIEEEIDRISRRLGKMTEPETVTNEEDVLNVSFQKSDAAGVVEEGAEKKENSLLLKYFSAATRAALMGKKKDESIVIQLATAFEEKEREWLAGDLGLDKDKAEDMAQSFLLHISKIAFVEKRPMDEAFFKDAMPGKDIATEDAFRTEIRNQIAAYWKQQAQHLLEHEIFHILSEETKMEVAREEIMDSIRQQLMGYFGSMNMGGNYEWLDSYVEKMMSDKQQVEGAYQRVFSSKVLEWAASQAQPTEKIVSPAEFQELQGKHNH
jgi:trigger factor